MATNRRPGGYADRQALAQAMQALKRARQTVGQIVDQRPGPQALVSMLLIVAVELGRAQDALDEMRRIREKAEEP
jgi:hypothetical protein